MADPSPQPRESIETVGRLGGRQICEYGVSSSGVSIYIRTQNNSHGQILAFLIATGHREQAETRTRLLYSQTRPLPLSRSGIRDFVVFLLLV
eukprot:scaffold68498_cov35-Cyclotella_meneghiniana.AAC.1